MSEKSLDKQNSERLRTARRLLISNEPLTDSEKDITVEDLMAELEKIPPEEQREFWREYREGFARLASSMPVFNSAFRDAQLSTMLSVAPLRYAGMTIGTFKIRAFIENELEVTRIPYTIALIGLLYRGERGIVERAIARLLELVGTDQAILIYRGIEHSEQPNSPLPKHAEELDSPLPKRPGLLLLNNDKKGLNYVDILSLGDVLSNPKKAIPSDMLMHESVRQLLRMSRARTEQLIAEENKELYSPSYNEWRGNKKLSEEGTLDQATESAVPDDIENTLVDRDLADVIVEQIFNMIDQSSWRADRKRNAIALLRYYEEYPGDPGAVPLEQMVKDLGLNRDTIIERKKDLRKIAIALLERTGREQ